LQGFGIFYKYQLNFPTRLQCMQYCVTKPILYRDKLRSLAYICSVGSVTETRLFMQLNC